MLHTSRVHTPTSGSIQSECEESLKPNAPHEAAAFHLEGQTRGSHSVLLHSSTFTTRKDSRHRPTGYMPFTPTDPREGDCAVVRDVLSTMVVSAPPGKAKYAARRKKKTKKKKKETKRNRNETRREEGKKVVHQANQRRKRASAEPRE